MTEILHISDTHGQRETLVRIEKLALDLSDCDVVALTGDCTSLTTTKVPKEWDSWPHRLKLAVPGNHDPEDAFDSLSTWRCVPPWVASIDGIGFVGLDTSVDLDWFEEGLARAVSSFLPSISAIVVLTHRWPHENGMDKVGEASRDACRGRSVLILHGHDHPAWFPGSLWERGSRLGDLVCSRSQVYSAADGKRGMAHLISFKNGAFGCAPVQAAL